MVINNKCEKLKVQFLLLMHENSIFFPDFYCLPLNLGFFTFFSVYCTVYECSVVYVRPHHIKTPDDNTVTMWPTEHVTLQ